MPGSAVKLGAAERIESLHHIPAVLLELPRVLAAALKTASWMIGFFFRFLSPKVCKIMTAIATSPADTTAAHSAMAFQFVSELATEVSKGRVELPAFPDVATRVRKALADDDVSADHIARVVGSEAGLAARVMTLANSAALNRSGKNITELKTAISRIGQNNVRTAAMSFAISQLRRAPELKKITKELESFGMRHHGAPCRMPLRRASPASTRTSDGWPV